MLWGFKFSRLTPTYMFTPAMGHFLITSPNRAHLYGPNVQMSEPLRDISHSERHSNFERIYFSSQFQGSVSQSRKSWQQESETSDQKAQNDACLCSTAFLFYTGQDGSLGKGTTPSFFRMDLPTLLNLIKNILHVYAWRLIS